LEVGTGFHQELTGRENIYISGYILGMTKHEIRSKFDEIVAFSGIEQFIDTPVKRYSSGMYVRLAFAVAAHLEPDILIVDEVLAVGDADFQKKCLGKMREVSHSDGRTVLFVSHSMQAVNNLCSKALWLKKGRMQDIGNANEVVTRYINGMQKTNWKQAWETPQEAPGNNWVRVREVQMVPDLASPDSYVDTRTALTFHFSFWNMVDQVDLTVWIQLFSYSGECVFELPSTEVASKRGVLSGACTIPGNFLNEGAYYISFMSCFTWKNASRLMWKISEAM
jgi:lipopolysaccharide transport system ATP-binding protein